MTVTDSLSSTGMSPLLSALLGLLISLIMAAGAHASNRHAVVLQYHHVSPDTPAITSIPPEQFEQHLDWLEENGFSVLSLPEVINTLRSDRDFASDRIAAITFDDAGESVCTVAWSILKKRKLPFTVFINTQPIEQQFGSQCSWQQLRTMTDSGLMTPANHTHTHLHMLENYRNTGAWHASMTDEITKAQDLIEKNLGTSSTLFAYPYGEHNQAARELVANLGYIGFGQNSGAIGPHSDFRALPRFPASGRFANLETLATKLLSLPLPASMHPSIDNPVPSKRSENPPSLRLHPKVKGLDRLSCFNANGEPLPVTIDGNSYLVRATDKLSRGRHRYTCTMPSTQNGRYHWLSYQWLVQ